MMLVVDIILLLVLLGCAWLALTMTDMLHGVIIFIAFGLLVALAWVRLQAPDVAMAEAAVGSGLTGALMLSSLMAMRKRAQSEGLTSEVNEGRDDHQKQKEA